MTISYNWLKQYINTSKDVYQIAEVLTAIGLEVEGIEKAEAIKGSLKGVVVGHVLESNRHPDADRLSLTKVEIAKGENLQIVCGAPNIAEGQKVLVATVGTVLYPKGGDSLTIKKGKIRGQESHGMICAEDELGLGTSHAGIMVLDANAQIGMTAAEYLRLTDDYTLEIGLTPNRTDAFSHYGVARDLAAALHNMEGIVNEHVQATLPSITEFTENEKENPIRVHIESNDGCARYCGIALEHVHVQASPKWLQERLTAIGLRPINNIVDITNFVQHETGQPLHAFDARNISDKTIVVRTATDGEKIVTLDGVERTLAPTDLLICDTQNALCLAGVLGGLNSGVDENTTTIFLESANFNPVYVRKTSKKHGLKTDASFRFERGADINMCDYALKRAVLLMQEIAGAQVIGRLEDIYPAKKHSNAVTYNWERTTSLIGKELSKEKVKSILNDLDISVIAENETEMQLAIPQYRSDVLREADVVEEVLRIYGYNNVEIPARMHSSMSRSPMPDEEKLQNIVSDALSANGFHEMMGLSLVKTKYAELPANASAGATVGILNPLSSDLGVMRNSMLYTGLEALALNHNYRNTDMRAYEFGKVYSKAEGKYTEEKHLSIFITGRAKPESWNNTQSESSFSDLKSALEQVLNCLHITNYKFESSESNQMHECIACTCNKQVVAQLGNVNATLLKNFDLKQTVWYAELYWENLLKVLPAGHKQYREPDKYPAVRRDLSLLLQKQVRFADIEKAAFEIEKKLLRQVNLFDVYEGKNLDEGKKSYAISFVMQDSGKTMNDQQVEIVMSRIQKALEEKLGATLRT
ncbi:MAG: phenylalanine--tRNA ligase subunit beta [Flavobacteriales bacterium]